MTTTTTKAEKEKTKLVQEKCIQFLTQLLKDDDNKYCVDCDAKGPRWASWNLGVFLCIRCAGIHRNLGVHISKVKSVNLDAWTPEQVGYLIQMGNSKARAVYEANLPDNFRRPQTDSTLEAFIRSKYEQKKYIAKEWVEPPTPPPAFDVEEERKKEKEKKRQKAVTIVKTASTGNEVLSANNSSVPRPHSNPAGTVISADKIPVKTSSSSPSNGSVKSENDLLGLNFGSTEVAVTDDPFAEFDSRTRSPNNGNTGATPITNSNCPAKTSLADEEADFFNQKVPEKKLDKDSILKMFDSNAMNTPNNAFFNAVAVNPSFGASSSAVIPGNHLHSHSLFSGVQLLPQQTILTQQSNVIPGIVPGMTPASSATNPFLTNTPATALSGLNQANLTNSTQQVNQQMGSLNMNSGLVNDWMASNGSSFNPASTADFAQFPSSSSNNVLPNTVTAPSNGITAGINWGLTPINPAQSSLPSSDLWQ